jgi:hypothetical protein
VFAALPPWAAGAAYRAIPGVTAAMPVESRPLDAGKSVRGGTLLALDPATATAMAALPPGADGEAVRDGLARLDGARGTDVGIPLPGRPAAIAITVDTDLTVDEPAEPLDPSLPRTPLVVTVGAVLVDADGTLRRVEAAVPEPAEKGQRIVLPLTDEVGGTTVSPAWPLELVAIELYVASPSAATTRGTLEVTGVDVTDGVAAAGWTAVPLDAGAAGWRWTRTFASETAPYTPPASAPARVVMGDEPGMAPPVVGEIFAPAPGPLFRLSRLSAGSATTAVPALAGTSFLDATGARVGDTVAASVSGLPVTLEIVGSADAFPPVDPAVPFVVVDAPTLALARFAANGQANAPQEWWLATRDGASGSVADAVAGPPFSAAAVVDRAALERSLTSDPVPLGIIGAFGLGAIAAVLFAAIGFLLSASISTTERLGEFALLRALGLSPRQLAGWVSGESAFLLGFGFIGGALLGAILAWLVLPFSALTSTGERAVPTPAVVVPPEALAILLLIGLGLLAVTVAVVRRRVLSVSVAGVLRARDA